MSLINALADFEKLNRPSPAARRRLILDAFSKRKRYEAYLAEVVAPPESQSNRGGGMAIGYAIIFETYSSFLALPTLYLEDIFVLPLYRKQGVGLKLFTHCLKEAKKRGCGRMEWMVLDWNVSAIRFYEKIGAHQLKGWLPFRLQQKDFSRILTHIPSR